MHEPLDEPGTLLSERRRRLGWTAAELAARSHTSVSSINLLESGWRPRRSDLLDRVDAALTDGEEATR